jgi:TonB family protein
VVRVTSSAMGLSALGFSAVVHAAVLLVQLSHSTPSRGTRDDTVSIDLLADVPVVSETLEAEPTAEPPAGHATVWPSHTHPYPVPPGHDATPHDPNLVHMHLPASPSQATTEPPAAAAPVETAAGDTPRFTIAIGVAESDVHGMVSPDGSGPGSSHDHDDDAAVFSEHAVDSPARLAHGPAPSYPDAARSDGIEGDVHLELVVGVSGAVESARVVHGVGHGLDEAALRATRQFHFAPAIRAGHPVRVRMGWSMQFRLQ